AERLNERRHRVGHAAHVRQIGVRQHQDLHRVASACAALTGTLTLPDLSAAAITGSRPATRISILSGGRLHVASHSTWTRSASTRSRTVTGPNTVGAGPSSITAPGRSQAPGTPDASTR